jgi:Raf kinase inhibitor-like YbhB/YbcL family protein
MDTLDVSLEFQDFPLEHTCTGENSSPALTIEGIDAASSLAIMVFNPSVREVLSYCAWLIWDMPAVRIIPAGIPEGKKIQSPISALQGINDAGVTGWTGPCPKPGETHRYLFRVYGLDDFLQIPGGASKSVILPALQGHIVQYGETEAYASHAPPTQPAQGPVLKRK